MGTSIQHRATHRSRRSVGLDAILQVCHSYTLARTWNVPDIAIAVGTRHPEADVSRLLGTYPVLGPLQEGAATATRTATRTMRTTKEQATGERTGMLVVNGGTPHASRPYRSPHTSRYIADPTRIQRSFRPEPRQAECRPRWQSGARSAEEGRRVRSRLASRALIRLISRHRRLPQSRTPFRIGRPCT